MATLQTTADLSSLFGKSELVDSLEAELDGLLALERTTTTHLRADDPPSWIQLFADVAEWISPFKVVATVFLSQLAKKAADDLWKNKAAIAATLGGATLAPLRRLASALVSAKRRAQARTEVFVGIPLPDKHFGTALIVPTDSDEDAALALAIFISRVEEISAVVHAAIQAGEGPAAGARVLIRPDGKVVLRWQHSITLEPIERELS